MCILLRLVQLKFLRNIYFPTPYAFIITFSSLTSVLSILKQCFFDCKSYVPKIWIFTF
jgi:hypothetical protein